MLRGIAAGAACVGAVSVLGGGAAAPMTGGLILQGASHSGGAVAGSFSAAIVPAPTGAYPIKKVSVTEPVRGVHRIALAPEFSSHRWSGGKYVIGVTLTSANGSGVVGIDLIVGP